MRKHQDSGAQSICNETLGNKFSIQNKRLATYINFDRGGLLLHETVPAYHVSKTSEMERGMRNLEGGNREAGGWCRVEG